MIKTIRSSRPRFARSLASSERKCVTRKFNTLFLFDDPSVHVALGMRRRSERWQLLGFHRFDDDLDCTPPLIHPCMSRELRGKFYQGGFCHVCWAPNDELDFSTGEGVVDGHIVSENNLAVKVVFGGHSILSPSYRAITSLDRATFVAFQIISGRGTLVSGSAVRFCRYPDRSAPQRS